MVKTEGKSPAGKPRRRWGIILKCIFKTYESTACTGVNWFRRIKKFIGGGGCCEDGNEHKCSIKYGELLHVTRNC